MTDEDNLWSEITKWDWKSDARLTALELDRFPWWDNFDYAANTLINALEGAAQILESTYDYTPEQRQAVVLYYRTQCIRIMAELAAMQAERRPADAGQDT